MTANVVDVVIVPRIDERYACYRLEVRPSPIHRWGVFALEPIPPRRKVIEYTGEKISRREIKRRSQRELVYLFELNSYWCVDGAVGGSGAELINHSCDPNLYSMVMKGHVIYMSRRAISPGEELTVDYRFDKKMERVPCTCGSPKCRGTINLLR
ncbi:MAG TPA: SET domain-containing protein-lysine N-methyltransferase [Bryobacteraceae bacterium]|nr:SET domain-containing protein-lysine N-methyltransferase [Bryobacteraceae bacterium]HOL72276.1 SET domain-containing protein-lysine N-methyltransferase [Bryobacteraceae bacterium]HOQ45566.1 SET domain-containing protein-lysine N-methyltransferase [Bryobacteraceae bacterium]HPQ14583.1 SET domain-containing protein-lysine N-methyltransferase [Bryobacteraceae bacterium]HPU73396.1 SET domain-containing protein-lysine N-methyltransferase [Bryobacteraceae bacterium]